MSWAGTMLASMAMCKKKKTPRAGCIDRPLLLVWAGQVVGGRGVEGVRETISAILIQPSVHFPNVK